MNALGTLSNPTPATTPSVRGVRSHKPYFQRLTLTETAEVDTHSSVMNEAGDKMVTNPDIESATRSGRGTCKHENDQKCCSGIRTRKKKSQRGPCATVKFGSAVVPIYRTESKGRVRFTLCYHRDGKRLRQIFRDLAAAKKEAQFVAQRIQSGTVPARGPGRRR